jgi:Flp pilus assembly protein TadD
MDRRFARTALLAVPLALAIAVAGCGKKVDPETTASVGPPLTESDLERAVQGWGERYTAKPNDKLTALHYAAALSRSGRTAQAVAVMQKVTLKHAEDREVLAAYGKALAANGNFEEAMKIIRRAQRPDQPDWRLLSAEAAILDQTGQNKAARELYRRALDFAPNEPSILSNFAMSYVMTGELAEAEKLLRQAIVAPGADGRVRQNLALVVGLQGRFPEAEKIAAADLSPEEAAANIAYLRNMLAQPNNWKKLETSDAAPPKAEGRPAPAPTRLNSSLPSPESPPAQ